MITFDETPVRDLQEHPSNFEIYGNEDIKSLIDQIVASNWIKPLVVNRANNRIISGHRRWYAAKKIGLSHVPVEWREFANELDELEALLLENATRDKTPEQRVHEAEAWEEIEGEYARQRMLATQNNHAGKDLAATPNLAEQDKGETREKVADKVGMKKTTYAKAKKVVDKAKRLKANGKDKEAASLLDMLNNKSTDAAYKQLKKQEKKQANEDARAQLALDGLAVKLDESRVQIVHADFRDYLKSLPDNSVNLIFTDPPYDSASIPLYADLAVHAARVLKPGGSLLTYVGHYALPQVAQMMSEHLRYWWLIALSHQSGNHRRLEGKKVYVHWKPMLWYVKETYEGERAIADLIETDQPDKQVHDWEQGLKPAKYFIEYLTEPGDLVVDPMCGSGTTCRAALETGRRVIGVEIDLQRANVAKANLRAI